MSFILLHRENGFCDFEPTLISIAQIVTAAPVVGSNRWANRPHARITLTDGMHIEVKETFETIMGLLREASGQKFPGTGPLQAATDYSKR